MPFVSCGQLLLKAYLIQYKHTYPCFMAYYVHEITYSITYCQIICILKHRMSSL